MLTPTDKAAIEGLIQKWRSESHYHAELGDSINSRSAARNICADELEQALQRLLAGETREADKPAGVPVSEIEKLWASIEHLPSMQCAGQFMSGMASLIKRFKDPHHG